MLKVLAAVAIYVGAAIVAFDPSRWDTVVVTLPRGHGIHSHDMLGGIVLTLGVVLLWRSAHAK